MIKFEFESKEQFERFMTSLLIFKEARETVTGEPCSLAQAFLWLYEKTGE